MTNEEILLNYTYVLNDANGHPQLCLYRDDALKAMAEAVGEQNEKIIRLSSYCAELQDKLGAKEKTINGLLETGGSMLSNQLLAAKDKEIADIKDAANELVQIKDWKDKHGKDLHYIRSVSKCWTNLKNLLK